MKRLLPFFAFFGLFACEDVKLETVNEEDLDKTIEEDIYTPPLLPKEGEVLAHPMPQEECLEKVPSCQCLSMEENALCVPQFASSIVPIPYLLKEKMKKVTWVEACPVSIDDLYLLRVLHWTEEKQIVWGEMILTKRVVEDARQVFEDLYQLQFPIHKMRPAVHYNGSDEDSMADNNSTTFNCRKVKGTDRWSAHSYGEAIDINPLWNPYVQGLIIYPENAKFFTDRSNVIPGMINKGDEIISVLERHGWQWGSKKKNVKDYQHFARKDHKE